MLEFMRQHYKKILVMFVVIIVIWFINLLGPDDDYNWFEGVVVDTLHPAFKMVNSVNNKLTEMIEVVVNYQEIKKENQQLRDKLADLQYNKQQITKIMIQNQRLRKLLNFKKYVPYQVVGTSVIGYSPDNWTSAVLIDRGEKVGIIAKMPVIAENGYLAGVIQRSSSHTAQAALLTDPEFVIGGLVRREESRALGVVKGQGKEQSKLVINNISWDADIQSEDIIVTSGLSKQIPKGIPIGKVISVTPDDYGLTQSATITPFVNLNKLEEVLVVTDYTAKTDEIVPPLKAYPSSVQE